METNKNPGMLPIDRLNDEGKRDFPQSLKDKMCKREEFRKIKYGTSATESIPEVVKELVHDLDRAIADQKYNRMWKLALISALASLASAVIALIAVAAN